MRPKCIFPNSDFFWPTDSNKWPCEIEFISVGLLFLADRVLDACFTGLYLKHHKVVNIFQGEDKTLLCRLDFRSKGTKQAVCQYCKPIFLTFSTSKMNLLSKCTLFSISRRSALSGEEQNHFSICYDFHKLTISVKVEWGVIH